MGPRIALAFGIAIAASELRAEVADTIGGHEEGWWRAAAASHEAEVEEREQAVALCEAREAPPAYDGVEGFVTRSRRDGRPYFVKLKRCDGERDALAAARTERDRFEEAARRLGVPPGWLR